MTGPVLDLSKVDVLINELFDPDESVRAQFQDRYSGQAIAFAEALAPAFARFSQFSDDSQHCVQTALVCGFVHGVLDDLVTSIKLLFSGKLTASGNILRQGIEGICMALMCAYQGSLLIGEKESVYWKMIEGQAKEVEGHLAAKQLVKNWERLGLELEGAEQLKTTLGVYHLHSHAGVAAMAYRMQLGSSGLIYIGGHFDEAKVDGYAVELAQRIEFAKLAVQTIDFMWPSVRAIAKSAKEESAKAAKPASE